MKKSFIIFALLTTVLAGCNQTNNQASTDTSRDKKDSPLQVMTSFYPLYFITAQVAGSQAEVTNLAEATDVHDYEPSPQDLVKLNTADLVVFQGAELEPWAEDVVPQLEAKNIATLEVSHDLELAKMEAHDEHEDHDEDEDEHHEEEEHEDEHDEHHHGEFDPHTWLDPVLAQQMTDAITEALINVDPANQQTYQTNANTLKNKFAQLDQAFSSQLANCQNDEVIVAHDAYGYLARRYNFTPHAIAGLSTNDEPSAKIMAQLKAEADEGITHVLVEENKVQKFAETLAAETGLVMLPINPLGRGTIDANKDFFDVMEANLNSLKTALNCQ